MYKLTLCFLLIVLEYEMWTVIQRFTLEFLSMALVQSPHRLGCICT